MATLKRILAWITRKPKRIVTVAVPIICALIVGLFQCSPFSQAPNHQLRTWNKEVIPSTLLGMPQTLNFYLDGSEVQSIADTEAKLPLPSPAVGENSHAGQTLPEDPISQKTRELVAEAKRYELETNHAAAQRCLLGAIALSPNNIAIRLELVASLCKSGELTKAIAEAEAACSVAPKDVYARRWLAYLHYKAGNPSGASIELQTAIESQQAGPEAWDLSLMGKVSALLDRPNVAIAAFQGAIAREPNLAEAYNGLASAYERIGNKVAALESMSKAAQIEPFCAIYQSNLCAMLSRAKEHNAALMACNAAVELDSSRAASHANLGEVLLRLGRWEEAARAFGRSAELEPEVTWNRLGLATALYAGGKYREAAQECRRVAAREPNNEAPMALLGIIALQQGEFRAATEEFRRALAVQGESAQLHTFLGVGLFAMWRIEEAVAEFRIAKGLDPSLASTRYHLARSCVVLGMRSEAIAELKEAIRLEPVFGEYANTDGLLGTLRVESEFAVLGVDRPVEAIDSRLLAVSQEEEPVDVGPVLEQLKRAVQGCESFSCKIRYWENDRVNLSATLKSGVLLWRLTDDGPNARVSYDRVVVDGVIQGREWYLLIGRWLTHARERTKTVTRHELCQEGCVVDLYDLGVLPLPMVFADRERVLRDFRVSATQVNDFGGRAALNLVLIPRPWSRHFRRVEQVVIAIERDSGMPIGVQIWERGGMVSRGVEIAEVMSVPNDGSEFAVDALELGDWANYVREVEPFIGWGKAD